MTSTITFSLERLTGAKTGGAEVVARLVHREGVRHGPRRLSTNSLVSLAAETATFDAAGNATLELIRNSDLPDGWYYEIAIRGQHRSGVFSPVYVPDGDRSFDQLIGQVDAGAAPRFALITNAQLTALIDGHGIGVLTASPLSGSGRTGDAITIADGGVTRAKLAQVLRDDVGGAVAFDGIDADGAGNVNVSSNEGSTKQLYVGYNTQAVRDSLAGLGAGDRLPIASTDGNLPASRVSGLPAVPAGGHAGQDDLDAVEAEVDELQARSGALRKTTRVLDAAAWTQGVGGAATRLPGSPAFPAVSPTAELTLTIGGDVSGSGKVSVADVGTANQTDQLSGGASFTVGGLTFFIRREGGDGQWLVACDSGGAYTITADLDGISIADGLLATAPRTDKQVEDLADGRIDAAIPEKRRLPDYAVGDAGSVPKVQADGQSMRWQPESGGLDQDAVDARVAAEVASFARTDTNDRMPEAREPLKTSDVVDAFTDSSGWQDEAAVAATNAMLVRNSIVPTLANAPGLAYTQTYTNPGGTRLTGIHIIIRVPTAQDILDFRLISGNRSDTDPANRYHVKVDEEDWTGIGTQGAYEYYAATMNLDGDDSIWLQRRTKIEPDPAKIDVLRAADAPPSRLLPVPAGTQDTGKRPAVNATGDGYDLVPAGGTGGVGAPAVFTDHFNASEVVITTGTTAGVWTDWEDVISYVIPANQAGVNVVIGHTHGVSDSGDGGGDRIFSDIQLVLQRAGQTDLQKLDDRGYVRNAGNFGNTATSPPDQVNEASRHSTDNAVAVVQLNTGDTLKLQVKVISQTPSETMRFAASTATARNQLLQVLTMPTNGARGAPGEPGPAGASFEVITPADYIARRTAGTLDANTLYIEDAAAVAGTSTPVRTEHPVVSLPTTGSGVAENTNIAVPASGTIHIYVVHYTSHAKTAILKVAGGEVDVRVLRDLPSVVPDGRAALLANNSFCFTRTLSNGSYDSNFGRFCVGRSNGGYILVQRGNSSQLSVYITTVV